MSNEDKVKETLDKVFESIGARPVRSTDFAPLPESEWSEEDLDRGYRFVARRSPSDERRLDVYMQFRNLSIMRIDAPLLTLRGL